ncbi:MAG: DUF1059 domain-containing protein [Deltaproteobacteria bacterium]|nr:DUF1059 domain-containing protein [Deltaproteobacteria bacterium]
MEAKHLYLDCRTLDGWGCELTIAGPHEEIVRIALAHGRSIHEIAEGPHATIQVRAALDEVQPLVPAPGRKVLDCRDLPGRQGCSVSFTGPTEEIVSAELDHAAHYHRAAVTLELEDEIRLALRDETPATYPLEMS